MQLFYGLLIKNLNEPHMALRPEFAHGFLSRLHFYPLYINMHKCVSSENVIKGVHKHYAD